MPKVLSQDNRVDKAAHNILAYPSLPLPYHMRGCKFSMEESVDRAVQMRVRRRIKEITEWAEKMKASSAAVTHTHANVLPPHESCEVDKPSKASTAVEESAPMARLNRNEQNPPTPQQATTPQISTNQLEPGCIEGSLVRQVNSNRQMRVLTMQQTDETGPLEAVNDAQLSKMPRDLISLWMEYQFGLGGRKAACLFTTAERNANQKIKQKFYRRGQIWECMKRQIQRGLTPEQAVAELRTVYGSKTSVSKIIDSLIADKKRYKDLDGYHPNLSV